MEGFVSLLEASNDAVLDSSAQLVLCRFDVHFQELGGVNENHTSRFSPGHFKLDAIVVHARRIALPRQLPPTVVIQVNDK